MQKLVSHRRLSLLHLSLFFGYGFGLGDLQHRLFFQLLLSSRLPLEFLQQPAADDRAQIGEKLAVVHGQAELVLRKYV